LVRRILGQRLFLTERAVAVCAVATAVDLDAGWVGAVARTGHLAPGFAVDVADGAAASPLRKEINLLVKLRHGYGDHVPEVLGDDVDGDEVDFIGGIAAIVAPTFDDIMRVDEAARGFDLDSPEFVAGVEDEVVALAVSPGPGDSEAEACGFGEESGFGSLAVGFTRRQADRVQFGDARNDSFATKKKAQPNGRAF